MNPKSFKAPKPGVHQIVEPLLRTGIEVSLVGAGGNGSLMLSLLARLHFAMVKLGHPGGLNVTVWDPDKVSESNVGRQLFYPSDVGQLKSFVLVNRLNMAFGLDWNARDTEYRMGFQDTTHLIISCVDSAKSRRDIHSQLLKCHSIPKYWLDLGNTQRGGQVILGQPKGSVTYGSVPSSAKTLNPRDYFDSQRLPLVTEVFPDLLDESIAEDNAPSCSLAEALEKQDLFVNQHIATWAAELLWELLRYGRITRHGAFINLETAKVNPLMVPSHIGRNMRGK